MQVHWEIRLTIKTKTWWGQRFLEYILNMAYIYRKNIVIMELKSNSSGLLVSLFVWRLFYWGTLVLDTALCDCGLIPLGSPVFIWGHYSFHLLHTVYILVKSLHEDHWVLLFCKIFSCSRHWLSSIVIRC